jgi:hypothetical protein
MLAQLRAYAQQEKALGGDRFQRMMEITLVEPQRSALAGGAT